MSTEIKVLIFLLLVIVDFYVLFQFQHYFGINGVEWAYFLGFLFFRELMSKIGTGLAKT